jgi:hypothetical protein
LLRTVGRKSRDFGVGWSTEKTRLLRVTLSAQPSDAVVAVHPLVDFRFAFETCDLNRLDTRTFGHDIPVALGNSHRFETYFCFDHPLLCQRFDLKSKGSKVSRPDLFGSHGLSSNLKDVMAKAGVIDVPTMYFLESI